MLFVCYAHCFFRIRNPVDRGLKIKPLDDSTTDEKNQYRIFSKSLVDGLRLTLIALYIIIVHAIALCISTTAYRTRGVIHTEWLMWIIYEIISHFRVIKDFYFWTKFNVVSGKLEAYFSLQPPVYNCRRIGSYNFVAA